MKPLSEARVAIVFEWFQRFGGIERVIAGGNAHKTVRNTAGPEAGCLSCILGSAS